MIRMIQSSSAGHAKAYFSDALSKADYYLDSQEQNGRIQGKIALRLGIEGTATKETFFALCENVHPGTGERLTPRTKEGRTAGYDINFHCPKSVSVLHALSQDEHLQEAFQASVEDTMKDIEADSKTRVRKGGKYEDRNTGELVWADFIHQTARPVDGSPPDPHLHCHCFVFNVTWDEQEKKMKAGQFRDIKRDMPYYQARFHKRFSDRLMELGYQIRKTDKSFEIEGVPQKVVDQFSKRTDEIGRVAKEKGITDARELDELGARTRSKKQKGMTMTELRKDWRQQISELDIGKNGEGTQNIRFTPIKESAMLQPSQCVDHALLHCFERASVMQDRRILETAYRYGLGNSTISVDQITENFKNDKRIIHINEKSRNVCTTKEVLMEEKRMVELAREGKGKLVPLYKETPELALSGQQAAAVSHVLTTSDRVSIIRGAAGSGKTTLMKEAISWMEKAGKQVSVVAPTAQASRGVLKGEGYENAETVAKLLVDEKMQEKLKDNALWVDEAGLLGTKDMTALLELTTKQNARLILGGDTKQHASVVRGDALRILNTVAGIRTAEVNKIYRQKEKVYRSAVEDLSKGNVGDAFQKLDSMGSIKNIDPMKPNEKLVNDYIRTIKKDKSALIISPTHKQGEEVTEEIRKRLRSENLIGKKEISINKLSNLNLTEAEKSDSRNFHQGNIIQFNQNVPGIKRGSIWSVDSIREKQVHIKDENNELQILPLNKSARFDVFEQKASGLSKGDKVRITRNGFDEEKKRLDNGDMLEVVKVSKTGNIVLQNTLSKTTYKVKQDFGHLAHAHCITSYASQGKTVDEVFIAQPAATFPATDAKQFYVSVSRARENVHIYTDDKQALLQHAAELCERQSAMELVSSDTTHKEYVQQRQREEHLKNLARQKDVNKKPLKDKDYDR